MPQFDHQNIPQKAAARSRPTHAAVTLPMTPETLQRKELMEAVQMKQRERMDNFIPGGIPSQVPTLQRLVNGPVMANALAPGQVIQKKDRDIEVTNYVDVADELNNLLTEAVADFTQVSICLAKMDQNPTAIKTLREVYKATYITDLEVDVAAKFKGDDLKYLKRLMTDGQTADSNRPAARLNFKSLAEALDTAIDGEKTDVKKVYAVLAQLKGTPALVDQLKAAYKTKTGTELTSDLATAMKGDDLVHARQLIADHSGIERINVKSDEEAKDAKEIIKYLKDTYGVEVNSQAGVDAIKKDYPKVPKKITDQLRTAAWEYRELVALKSALESYAPILGDMRLGSNRVADAQEVTTVSKVDQALNKDRKGGRLDTETMGEYFESAKNFGAFTKGSEGLGGASVGGPFASNQELVQTTMIHELAHGLLEYRTDDFVKAMNYWLDEYTPSGTAGAEEPPTKYGKTSASEDLSETAFMFFFKPADLKKSAPLRYKFMEDTVNDWKKP